MIKYLKYMNQSTYHIQTTFSDCKHAWGNFEGNENVLKWIKQIDAQYYYRFIKSLNYTLTMREFYDMKITIEIQESHLVILG